MQAFERKRIVPTRSVGQDCGLQPITSRRMMIGRRRRLADDRGPMMAADEAHPWKVEFAEYLGQDQARLYGYIHSLVRDVHDADDLFQQTTLILWKKFGEFDRRRSEEHTSELQSRFDLVCRLLLE